MRPLTRAMRIWPEGLVIYWITDTHLIAAADGDPNHAEGIKLDSRYIYTVRAKLRHFVDQANAADADFAIHTGDLVERYEVNSINMVMDEWDRLEVAQALTIGNHDVASGTYADLVSGLGYSEKTENAGSKFNQSYGIDRDGIAVRILTLDTCIDDAEDHVASVVGYVQPALATWVENELAGATEKVALIFMHHSPSVAAYFDSNSLARLNTAIANGKSSNSGLRVYVFWGHHHVTSWRRSHALANRVRGFVSAAAVEWNPSRFTVLNVLPDRDIRMRNGLVRYPYSS